MVKKFSLLNMSVINLLSCCNISLILVYSFLHSYYFIFTTYTLASGVFSESTVKALEYYGKEYPDFLETARFVKFVLAIWKLMSLKTPSKGQLQKCYMFRV